MSEENLKIVYNDMLTFRLIKCRKFRAFYRVLPAESSHSGMQKWSKASFKLQNSSKFCTPPPEEERFTLLKKKG